jgi:hypothetical protein
MTVISKIFTRRSPVGVAILVAVGMIAFVDATLGGFQIKRQIGKLSLGGWQLKSRDGQLGISQIESGKWSISAPTITDASGLFIAGDPAGKTATVHLLKEKGPHAHWAFEFTQTLKPQKAGPSEGLSNANKLVGKSGFCFRMKLVDGPVKGWYASVDAVPGEPTTVPSKAADWRPLKLVQDPKLATEFEYVDAEYEVGHK